MSKIEIVDELPAAQGNKWYQEPDDDPYREYAVAARGNPGKWVKLPTHNSYQARNIAYSIRKGRKPGFRDGVYDAKMRNGELYVTWLGDQESE